MKMYKAVPFVMWAMLTQSHVYAGSLGYLKSAETLPQGAQEATLSITQKEGKRYGSYKRDEYRAEYAYGLTNDLSAAFYLNGIQHNFDCGTGCAGGPDDADKEISGSLHQSRMTGASIELKKNLLSPYKDHLGLALLGEVTYATRDNITGEKGVGWGYETKLIFQKPYLDGQLQWLTNLELEVESWKAEGGSTTEWAVAPRLRTGVSYRFAPKWSVGLEGWIDKEILNSPGVTNDGKGGWEMDHWDLFAGPSIHYGDKSWWFTVTAVKQIAGSDESNNNHKGRHLADHEKKELRVKVGYNF